MEMRGGERTDWREEERNGVEQTDGSRAIRSVKREHRRTERRTKREKERPATNKHMGGETGNREREKEGGEERERERELELQAVFFVRYWCATHIWQQIIVAGGDVSHW